MARSTDCDASARARNVELVFSWLLTRTVSTAENAERPSFSTPPSPTNELEMFKIHCTPFVGKV